MQIWNQENGKTMYVRNCGSAKKLNEKLVRLENLEEAIQTKTNNQTNFYVKKKPHFD